MTRYEAALEAAIMSGVIRASEEPGLVVSAALLSLLSTELFTSAEVAEIQAFVDATKRMNNRDFADEMATEFLALIRKLEPGASLLQ